MYNIHLGRCAFRTMPANAESKYTVTKCTHTKWRGKVFAKSHFYIISEIYIYIYIYIWYFLFRNYPFTTGTNISGVPMFASILFVWIIVITLKTVFDKISFFWYSSLTSSTTVHEFPVFNFWKSLSFLHNSSPSFCNIWHTGFRCLFFDRCYPTRSLLVSCLETWLGKKSYPLPFQVMILYLCGLALSSM